VAAPLARCWALARPGACSCPSMQSGQGSLPFTRPPFSVLRNRARPSHISRVLFFCKSWDSGQFPSRLSISNATENISSASSRPGVDTANPSLTGKMAAPQSLTTCAGFRAFRRGRGSSSFPQTPHFPPPLPSFNGTRGLSSLALGCCRNDRDHSVRTRSEAAPQQGVPCCPAA
jgi:hypothetical protein